MNELSVMERRDLRHFEAIIEKGLSTFIDVGQALKSVRDGKLYRDGFKTFEAYVSERWGMDRSYAHRLIDASDVKEDLLPIGNKTPRAAEIVRESQLRELVAVPDDVLEEVVEKAVELAGDSPITAKVLRQAREEVYHPEPKPEPAKPVPEPADWTKLKIAAIRYGEAFVRAIDDLYAVKRFHDQPKAVSAAQEAIVFLRNVK